jgi:hypothetical protein
LRVDAIGISIDSNDGEQSVDIKETHITLRRWGCPDSRWRNPMSRYLAALASAAAVLALVVLTSGAANAGASASAPTKNKNTTTSQQQAKQNYPISEYSSSSRKH